MKKIILILLFITCFLFGDNIGKIVAFKGNASILRDGNLLQINKNSTLMKNDIINTKDDTKIQILFKDETIISIGQNSTLKINDYLFEENNVKAEFSMAKGVFRTITGKIGKIAPENFKLRTKTASIGIRGTQIVTSISDNSEKIFCTEGQIEIRNNFTEDKVIVNKGEFVSFDKNTFDKIDVKKTKEKDIQDINKNISIKENIAVDTISLKNDDKETLNNKLIKPLNPTNLAKRIEEKREKPLFEKIDEIPPPNKSINNENISTIENTINTITENDTKLSDNNTTIVEEIITTPIEEEPSTPAAEETVTPVEQESSTPAVEETVTPVEQEPSTPAVEETVTPVEQEPSTPAAEETLTPVEQESSTPAVEETVTPVEIGPEIVDELINKTNTDGTNIEDTTTQEDTTTSDIEDNNLELITNRSFFENNSSSASYIGNFNSYDFNSGQQYLKDINNDKVEIPNDTSISMDIDFGATTKQISNGEININDVGDGTSRTLTFEGEIDTINSSFELSPSGDTKGNGGTGNFYGSDADLIQGDVNMKSSDNVQISGSFDATKQ